MSVIATAGQYFDQSSIGSSTDIDDAVFDNSLRAWGITEDVVGDWTSELPIDVESLTADGVKSHSFLDDYYYRIWILPAILNLGRILSESNHDIEVWNSFFEARDYGPIVITGDDTGTHIWSGDTDGTLNALESQIRNLHTDPEGADSVSVAYDFVFQESGGHGIGAQRSRCSTGRVPFAA
jgi:hypothetical protein